MRLNIFIYGMILILTTCESRLEGFFLVTERLETWIFKSLIPLLSLLISSGDYFRATFSGVRELLYISLFCLLEIITIRTS